MARRPPRPYTQAVEKVPENTYYCARCDIYLLQSQLKNYDCPHCMGLRLEFVPAIEQIA